MPARPPLRSVTRLAATLIATVVTAAGLVGCATTVDGTGAHSGSTDPAAAASGDLSAKISSGMESLVSAHLLSTTNVSGLSISAEGDETFAGGVVTGFRIASTILGIKVVLLLASGQGYMQANGVGTADKPWVKVESTSSNTLVRSMYPQLQAIRDQSSKQALAGFADAASKIVVGARKTVAGVTVTPYALTIEVARLPETANKKTLLQGGIKTVQTTLDLDSQYRVVQIEQHGTVRGQSYTNTMTLSSFNEAVNIAAPSDDQISPS